MHQVQLPYLLLAHMLLPHHRLPLLSWTGWISRHCKYTTVQCSAVQCSAMHCSAVQCSAVQCSAVQCSAWYLYMVTAATSSATRFPLRFAAAPHYIRVGWSAVAGWFPTHTLWRQFRWSLLVSWFSENGLQMDAQDVQEEILLHDLEQLSRLPCVHTVPRITHRGPILLIIVLRRNVVVFVED